MVASASDESSSSSSDSETSVASGASSSSSSSSSSASSSSVAPQATTTSSRRGGGRAKARGGAGAAIQRGRRAGRGGAASSTSSATAARRAKGRTSSSSIACANDEDEDFKHTTTASATAHATTTCSSGGVKRKAGRELPTARGRKRGRPSSRGTRAGSATAAVTSSKDGVAASTVVTTSAESPSVVTGGVSSSAAEKTTPGADTGDDSEKTRGKDESAAHQHEHGSSCSSSAASSSIPKIPRKRKQSDGVVTDELELRATECKDTKADDGSVKSSGSSGGVADTADAGTTGAEHDSNVKEDQGDGAGNGSGGDQGVQYIDIESDFDAAANPLILTGDKRRGLYECDYCRRDISQVPRIVCAVCPEFDLCLECFSTTDPGAARTMANAGRATVIDDDEAAKSGNGSGAGATSSYGSGVAPSVEGGASASGLNVGPSSSVSGIATVGDGGSQSSGGTGSGVVKASEGGKQQQHCSSHGYRVADSTRFPLFPSAKIASAFANAATTTNSQLQTQSKTSTPASGSVAGDGADQTPTADNQSVASSQCNDDVVSVASSSAAAFTPASGGGPVIITDNVAVTDAKNQWTVEEDLRLLDAISTYGLGNWADIAEAVGSGGIIGGGGGEERVGRGGGGGERGGGGRSDSVGGAAGNFAIKSARKCMERYLDDYLGRYGHILPPYTLVEVGSDDEVIGSEGGEKETKNPPTSSVVAAATCKKKKRKTVRKVPLDPVDLQSAMQGKLRQKKRICVATTSLPGYENLWTNAYVPATGVSAGDRVGRDSAYKKETAAVKALASASNPEEAASIRAEWERRGAIVIPPRMEDVQNMPGSELAGYLPRRGDFDVEWDNEAEAILADMEFSPNDHPAERQLKLQVIEIYNSRLDERERRKKFLREWNLLDYRRHQLEERMKPPDERDLIQRMRLFARFHSRKDHEDLIHDLLRAKQLRRDIAQLQRYRRMGIRTLAEAERYDLDKSRREHHKVAQKQKEAEEKGKSVIGGISSGAKDGTADLEKPKTSSDLLWPHYKVSDRKNRRGGGRGGSNISGSDGGKKIDGVKKDDKASNEGQNRQNQQESKKSSKQENEGSGVDAGGSSKGDDEKRDKVFEETPEKAPSSSLGTVKVDEFDISSMRGFSLLSSKEVALCKNLLLIPEHYLHAKRALIQESLLKGMLPDDNNGAEKGSSKKAVYKLDVEKRDGVIDFILRSGWIAAKPSYAV